MTSKLLNLISLTLMFFAGCTISQKTHILLVSTVMCDYKCAYNYGAEADVLRAYHLLRKRGVPEENIILMTPDNFVHSGKNPWPGHFYDGPGKEVDLRKNVKIDYSGPAVNRENIIAVLTGKSRRVRGGSGRVLKSTPEDNIFVFWAGHGDLDALMMPDHFQITGDIMDQMIKHVSRDHYRHLVMYFVSCMGGSLFSRLDPNLNALVFTSSKATEFSKPLGVVDVPEAVKLNKKMAFGTEFGKAWFEALEQAGEGETIGDQIRKIQQNRIITNATPSVFGDHSIERDRISIYFGGQKGGRDPSSRHHDKPRRPEYPDYLQQEDYDEYGRYQERPLYEDYYQPVRRRHHPYRRRGRY